MVIAEAPSASEGQGTYFGGELEKFLDVSKKSKGLKEVIEFIKEGQGTTPYFTDVYKCGVPRQNDKSGLNSVRRNKCVDTFLIEEIRIINPKVIFCIGNIAFNTVLYLKNKQRISKDIRIVKLIHYSKQANMPLSTSDKLKIWKIQTGNINNEKFIEIIINLDFVKALRKNQV